MKNPKLFVALIVAVGLAGLCANPALGGQSEARTAVVTTTAQLDPASTQEAWCYTERNPALGNEHEACETQSFVVTGCEAVITRTYKDISPEPMYPFYRYRDRNTFEFSLADVDPHRIGISVDTTNDVLSPLVEGSRPNVNVELYTWFDNEEISVTTKIEAEIPDSIEQVKRSEKSATNTVFVMTFDKKNVGALVAKIRREVERCNNERS